ncbi:MAG: hypothetical protein IT372_37730 [Polyangiaceae bacterium]|nr:hypothetical protein [Polyangiaceae bacterium]
MRTRHLRPASSCPRPALAPLALLSLAAGCDGCPSSRPYTPFTIDDAGAPAASAPVDGSGGGATAAVEDAGVEAGPAFAAVPGVAAPEGGKRWELEGGAGVDAPVGRAFETGMVIDADGDGTRDLVAWARAPDGLRGELWFASGKRPAEGRAIAGLPGDLGARGCSPEVRLSQVGPATLALDFNPRCGARLRGKATRWIAVVGLGRAGAPDGAGAPEVALELRVREPAADEAIEVVLDASDRDADGRDDLTAMLSLAGMPRGLGSIARAGAVTGTVTGTGAVTVTGTDTGAVTVTGTGTGAVTGTVTGTVTGPGTGTVTGPGTGAVTGTRTRTVTGTVTGTDAGTGAGFAARVPLVFFGRPAGLSRDPSQPGEALKALAAGLLAEALRKDAAPGVAGSALMLRRLHALVCEGSSGAGEPIVAAGGGSIRCGEPGIDAAIAHAEGVAASTSGDPIAAIAALERARGRSKDVDRLLAKLAPPATAQVARRVAARPDAAEGWGPLAFDANGDLLVRTGEGVVRVDHATFEEAPASAAAWPAALVAGGSEVTGVERRCDAPALVALVRRPAAGGGDAPAGAEQRAVPLPILAAAGRCADPERVPFAPLGASERAIDLAIGAALISIDLGGAAPSARRAALPLAEPAPQGAARSPDGATLAVRAAGGLLVSAAGGRAQLWSGEGVEQASACAPQNGGRRVACVSGGAAVIYEAK